MRSRAQAHQEVGGERRKREDDRLTVARCRALVGSSCSLTDEQLIRLRNKLYDLGDVIVSLVPGSESREVIEVIEERAAIMEIDGGLPATTAHRKAITHYIKGRQ